MSHQTLADDEEKYFAKREFDKGWKRKNYYNASER